MLAGRSSRDSAIREVMTEPVISVRADRSIRECLGIMTEQRVRHLPVLEGGAIRGLVSIGDLVRATIAEQEQVIEQLQHYIAGA